MTKVVVDSVEGKRWADANVVQTGIYLWQGFMSVVWPNTEQKHNERPQEQQDIYDSHFDNLGQDGGALSIGYVVSALEEAFSRWAHEDFPGVYHYEITEPLGSWWAREGPKLDEFQYGEARRETAVAAVVERYNEMMAEWLVTDKLTTNAP